MFLIIGGVRNYGWGLLNSDRKKTPEKKSGENFFLGDSPMCRTAYSIG